LSANIIIERAAIDGVLLKLDSSGKLKATGSQSAINTWAEQIKQAKSEIIQALRTEAVITSWRWEVTLPDRLLVVTTSPESSSEEMQANYPDAISLRDIQNEI
jgi:hypothetical protein